MIRKATTKDLEAINNIYNQAVLHGYQTADTEIVTIKTRKDWFKNHDLINYPVFVFIKDETVVAWLSLSAYRPGRKALKTLAEISYYVHNDFQVHGIGTKLMEFALDVLRGLVGVEIEAGQVVGALSAILIASTGGAVR